MIWQGNDLVTIGDLMNAIEAIYEIADVEERQRTADTFMEQYRAENEHADENIGYLTGYFGRGTMVAMLRLFKTAHPVFGPPALADTVTQEGAYASGQAIGERMRGEAQN